LTYIFFFKMGGSEFNANGGSDSSAKQHALGHHSEADEHRIEQVCKFASIEK